MGTYFTGGEFGTPALDVKSDGEFWFWPISVIILFLGSYLVSVFCVLVLLYLPIPRGLIGTSWLITQIAKSLTISPLLGRWILFIGYSDRLRKRFAPLVLVDARRRYVLVCNSSGSAERTTDQVPITGQLEMLLTETRFVLVEHSVMPTLPQSVALACGSDDDGQVGSFAGAIPVLIAPSDWKDNIPTSASNVLRDHFSVPVDASEMLVGQMERGYIVFIIHSLNEFGEKLASVLAEIQKTMDMENFAKCYVRLLHFVPGSLNRLLTRTVSSGLYQ